MEHPFGLRAFWPVVIALLVILTAALSIAAVVREDALDRAAAIEATHYAPTLAPTQLTVFLGDSYTQGTGSSERAKDFVSLVSKREGWTFLNDGRGGTGYTTALSGSAAQEGCNLATCPNYAGMVATVARSNPTTIVVSGGRNDSHVSTSSEETAISAFYKALRAACPNAMIYATSPIWSAQTTPASLEPMRAAVKAAVTSVNGKYLDLGEPLQGHPELVIADGVHPNDQGHAAIAAALEARLKAVS